MNEKKPTRWERTLRFMGSKGFYIVLFLCVAVIGVAAWVMSYTMRQTGLDLSESLNETLGVRITANIPSPTVPTIATAEPNPSVNPLIPPVTAAPEASGESSDAQDGVYEEEYTEDVYESYDEEDDYYEAGSYDDTEIITVDAPSTFIWPVFGSVEKPHSVEALIYSRTMADWRTHSGVDIAAGMGAKVMAIADGVVERVYLDQLMGTVIVVNHGGGLRSLYANLANVPPVVEGNWVEMGNVIGSIGQTALLEAGDVTHLHLEMSMDGERLDPLEYLPAR